MVKHVNMCQVLKKNNNNTHWIKVMSKNIFQKKMQCTSFNHLTLSPTRVCKIQYKPIQLTKSI